MVVTAKMQLMGSKFPETAGCGGNTCTFAVDPPLVR
jgi:hypothetical protein